MNIHIGDVIFQLIMFLILIGIITAIFFVIRQLFRSSKNNKTIEQKLDKIIDLLEKEKAN